MLCPKICDHGAFYVLYMNFSGCTVLMHIIEDTWTFTCIVFTITFTCIFSGSCCSSAPGEDPVPRYWRSPRGSKGARQAVRRSDLCYRVYQYGRHRHTGAPGRERHPVSTAVFCTPTSFSWNPPVSRWNWTLCFPQLWWNAGFHPHRLPGANGSWHCVLGPYLPVVHQTGTFLN